MQRHQRFDRPILVVDDQPSNLDVILETLAATGYTNVIGTRDATKVADLYAAYSPDLVLLDLRMPSMDGFEVMAVLRARWESKGLAPILVLTADATPRALRRALAAGAKDFLTKPFDVTELALRCGNLLDTRLLELELMHENDVLEERVRERTAELQDAYEREHETSEKLRELDRMKDAFLVAVSHDVRTPLTVVLGMAATLDTHGAGLDAEAVRSLVEPIARNARKLERLLGGLLDVDRLRRGALEPLLDSADLAPLVERVVEDLRLDTRGRTINVHLEPCRALVDSAQVERIVEELIANVMRHTPPGTPAWIALESRAQSVLLTVEDAGPGVPDDEKHVIFERLKRGADEPSHNPGLGVGLALVAGFSAAHSGRAWVEDRPGGGASFKVELPLGPTPTRRAA